MSFLKNVMSFILKALANPKLKALVEHCDYVIAFVGEDQGSVGAYVGIVKAKSEGSSIEEDTKIMEEFVQELGNMFPEGKMLLSKDPTPKPVFMLPVNVLGAKFANVAEPER